VRQFLNDWNAASGMAKPPIERGNEDFFRLAQGIFLCLYFMQNKSHEKFPLCVCRFIVVGLCGLICQLQGN